MSDAWVFQRLEHIQKYGEEKAPWYVGWYEPDGRRRKKSCGEGFLGKRRAEKLTTKLTSELMTGTYQMQTRKLWKDVRREYDERVLARLASRTRTQAAVSLDHFERIVKPIRVF